MGVCDTQPERSQRLARHYRVPLVTDYRKLTAEIEAVNICTPTVTHFEIAQYFLEHGIHTFIEKPIALNLKEADDLNAKAEQMKLKLQVGHIERFNSAFQAISHFAKNPLFIESHRLNQFTNRSVDIGVVMDLMIHDIDIILGLMESPVKEVNAVGINVLTPLEDIASARIIFENGCVCNLTASRISDEAMRKIRLFLKDTYISLDYVKQEAFIYRKFERRILKHRLPIEKEEPLKKELESFVDCIRENRKPLVSGVEAREALKLALDISRQIWLTHQKITSWQSSKSVEPASFPSLP